MTMPVALAPDERLTIPSDVLGSVSIAANEIVRFPDGLYGFPECRSFALLPTPREGIFWLQSADFSALSFILVDPFVYFPGYHIELDDADIRRLGTSEAQHILVMAIVTMPSAPGGKCTANLHAPVLFNIGQRHAHQSIRPDDSYGFREPFAIEQAHPDRAVVA
jgi:flagellar assembly factor FliW